MLDGGGGGGASRATGGSVSWNRVCFFSRGSTKWLNMSKI